MAAPPPDSNPYASPRAPTREPRPDPGIGVWKDGALLVMHRDAVLPARCVRCNVPTVSRSQCKLHWTNPIWLLLFLPLLCFPPISIAILIVALLAVTHRVSVKVPLCSWHRRQRLGLRLLACLVMIASVLLYLVLPLMLWQNNLSAHRRTILGALLSLLGFSISMFLFHTSALLIPKRVAGKFIYIKQLCPAFLAELPPFPGRP